jgi:hypothetical protein
MFSKSRSENGLDFFELLVALLIVAFLILLGINVTAAIIVGIALLIIAAIAAVD